LYFIEWFFQLELHQLRLHQSKYGINKTIIFVTNDPYDFNAIALDGIVSCVDIKALSPAPVSAFCHLRWMQL